MHINQPMLDVYMQVTQKSKLKPAAPTFELGWPSQAVPVGRTVKASVNSPASEQEAGKNQYAVNVGAEWNSSRQHQPHTQ